MRPVLRGRKTYYSFSTLGKNPPRALKLRPLSVDIFTKTIGRLQGITVTDHSRGQFTNLSRFEGRLIGIMKSPARPGLTCIIEDRETLAPILCASRSLTKRELDPLVGARIELEGIVRYGDDGRILRVDDAELISPRPGDVY